MGSAYPKMTDFYHDIYGTIFHLLYRLGNVVPDNVVLIKIKF